MKILRLPLFALITMISSSAIAEQPLMSKRDGDWWLKGNLTDQGTYIVGLLDGIQAAGWLEIHAMDEAKYDKVQRVVHEALAGIHSDDLARNLTALYRDHPEWRDIRVSAAIWPVSMRMRGATEEELRDAIAMIRDHAQR
jgi:hypothetical protein